MTTQHDWARRWMEPRVTFPRDVPDRAERYRDVVRQVSDLWELGTFLYTVFVRNDDTGWFDGSADSILQAIKDDIIPRPQDRRLLNKTQLQMALIVYSGHTSARLDEWIEQARTVSAGSYLNYLVRDCNVAPYPRYKASALTLEAMKPSKAKARSATK